MALSTMIYERCPCCNGSGQWHDEDRGVDRNCPACAQERVVPVGLTQSQFAVRMQRSDLADTLLRAILHGHARWEWLGEDRIVGEVCVAGLRHTARLDADGMPILSHQCVAALQSAMFAGSNS